MIFARMIRVVWILIAVLAIAGAPLNPGPVQAWSCSGSPQANRTEIPKERPWEKRHGAVMGLVQLQT
jgi:hypothetical protein